MKYYIADYNGIPLREQPDEGYSLEEAIERVHREIAECVMLFGGKPEDYKKSFCIMDEKFHTINIGG